VIDILDGPVCTQDGIAWWQVEWRGKTGWTAEGQANTYWVVPNSDK
jgi:hypothetical protein